MASTRRSPSPAPVALWLLVALFAAGCRTPEPGAKGPAGPLAPKTEAVFAPRGSIEPSELAAIRDFLRDRIEAEIASKDIPAISIGLYDRDGILWADGFGKARNDGTPAGRDTVYRVGSVSKLFTDIAVMQRVERGELDLDAPITDVLPDFAPSNPFGVPITLRQLMCHRSGLVREPPVGNYFDDDGTSLADTVKSLNQTSLVHRPGTVTKYSNAGIAVVGYVLETLAGVPFEQAVREAVLSPLGMSNSDFLPSERVTAKLADAQMRTIDARRFDAPTFQLGMSPAGSLYSTVEDLSLFTRALLRREELLTIESFEQMFTPQFATPGANTGYGLGFRVATLGEGDDAVRRLGHGGAIYGFSTQLEFLPDNDLGVTVTANLDLSNGTVSRVADEALQALLLASRSEGATPGDAETPDPTLVELLAFFASQVPEPLQSDEVERLAGTYVVVGNEQSDGTQERFHLRRRGSDLVLDSGRTLGRLRKREEAGRILLMTDGPEGRSPSLELTTDSNGRPVLAAGGVELHRAQGALQDLLPAPADERFLDLIGEYGEDHNPLFLYEQGGRLWALIEWLERTPLRRVDAATFAIDSGMYVDETLTVVRGSDGSVEGVRLGPIDFARRSVGTASGETFRIDPVRPVAELRAEALAASPPEESGEFVESELIELTDLDPTIELDVRYASTDNFMSTVFYDEPRAFLQRPAAEALVRAHRRLRQQGYGLLIHDAYRPWYVTRMFWDATPEDKKIFVADPSSGSRHNRGCAVDLTLYDLATGEPVQMVGGYDEMTDRSFPDYLGGTERQRFFRELLRDAMESEGFEVYEFEWWHFDYRDWRKYALQNQTFDQL